MAGAHAELGASSASRWMACPGSIRLARGLPEKRSFHAAEGTAAHEIAETCLRERRNPEHFAAAGATVTVSDYPDPIPVTDDMARAVQRYLDYLGALSARGGEDDPVWIEGRVSLAPYADDKDDVLHAMFGTGDYIRYLRRERTLVVVDYKHGSGVKVHAEGNPQGRYYALGALALIDGQPVDRVEIHIVQPRIDEGEPSVEVLDTMDLLDWAEDLFAAARRTLDPDAPTVPGSHCRFCKAQGVCPSVRDKRMAQAQLVFTEAGRIAPAETTVQRLSADELAAIVRSADDIVGWVRAAQKLAHDLLEAGEAVGGAKLVRKRVVRKWRDERTAADWLCEEFGLGDEDIFEAPKMRSPAQVEKLLDADGQARLRQADLINAESSGTTLALADDNRPSVRVEKRPEPKHLFSPALL